MPSLFLLSLISTALPAAKGRTGTRLFTSVSPKTPNRWVSFVTSALIHVLALLFVPPLTVQFADQTEHEFWVRQERLLRTVRIRIPEQLYIASSGPVSPAEKKTVHFRPSKTTAAGADHGSRVSEPGVPGRSRTTRRRFELPPLPRRETTRTVLQPQFPPELPPSAAINLPEVFFWAPLTELPRFVKPFLMPGHVTRPTQPRVLDAPPTLEVPSAEPSPMNLAADFAGTLNLLRRPALPIRAADAGNAAPRTSVSTEPAAGDPTTLLSLSLDPARLREFLSVPPGNQIGRIEAGGRSGTISASRAGNGTAGSGASSHGNGSSGAGGGAGGGAGKGVAGVPPGSKPGQTAEGAPTAADPSAASSQAAANTEAAALTPAAARAAAIAAASATRISHPAGGVFDVVVQSSGAEGFPESAGVLSGKPVYSVFVRAGGSKDWLLQYCIPAGEEHAAQVNGPVVRLGSDSPVTAPYPHVTFRPPVKPKPGRRVMVHGMITAEGRFQDLRVLGATEPLEAAMVLGVLEQWEFRPAMRDRQGIRVEILLAIPAE